MTEFPQYDDDGSETLDFSNIWREIDPQEITGVDCFTPFVDLRPENEFLIKLTDVEFKEMFSALYNGAEITYPDRFMQIIVNFLRGLHCPDEIEDEQGCVNYKPYAPFINYEPQNPYNQPDLVPEGYLSPPFIVNTDFDYPEIMGYQATDVMVPLTSLSLPDSLEDFLELPFPTIKIHVSGEGQIELDLIQVQNGGRCVIKIGSPPNILDLFDGIVETGVTVVELGQDITSIPPESDIVSAQEIAINAPEGTDVYIVFVPNIDISTELFNHGGGVRQIGLCGLETDASSMGIEDIRIFNVAAEGDTPNWYLQKRIAGIWEFVENWGEFNSIVQSAFQYGQRANTMAEALRTIGDETGGWFYDGEFVGFDPSPLKDYIDATSFDPSGLEADIAAAAAAAAAAQSTANGAVVVNNTQNTAITAQAGYIGDLQTRMTDAETDISGQAASIVSLDNRVDALDFGNAWAWIHDMTLASNGYVLTGAAGSGYSSGNGWHSNSNGLEIYYATEQVKQNQISFVEVCVRYASAPTGTPQFHVNGGNNAPIQYNGVGVDSYGWYAVPNTMELDFTLTFLGSGDFYLRYVRYLGKGIVLPFD